MSACVQNEKTIIYYGRLGRQIAIHKLTEQIQEKLERDKDDSQLIQKIAPG